MMIEGTTLKTRLLKLMNQLSLKYFDCHWAKDLEYILYLQLSGCRFENIVSITETEENDLRCLSQQLCGWFYWDIEKAQPQFIDWASWNRVYGEWHTQNIVFSARRLPSK